VNLAAAHDDARSVRPTALACAGLVAMLAFPAVVAFAPSFGVMPVLIGATLALSAYALALALAWHDRSLRRRA
jgi:fatty acid desaturase